MSSKLFLVALAVSRTATTLDRLDSPALAANVIATARRLARTAKVVIAVSRKHLPRWLCAILAVAIAIPGPVDELIVMLIIGVFLARRPVMRAELVSATREAWAAA